MRLKIEITQFNGKAVEKFTFDVSAVALNHNCEKGHKWKLKGCVIDTTFLPLSESPIMGISQLT